MNKTRWLGLGFLMSGILVLLITIKDWKKHKNSLLIVNFKGIVASITCIVMGLVFLIKGE